MSGSFRQPCLRNKQADLSESIRQTSPEALDKHVCPYQTDMSVSIRQICLYASDRHVWKHQTCLYHVSQVGLGQEALLPGDEVLDDVPEEEDGDDAAEDETEEDYDTEEDNPTNMMET